MNERIRELFQEAIDYADKTHTYRFEVFAELIVRECAGIANRAGAIYFSGDKILKHFGVEE